MPRKPVDFLWAGVVTGRNTFPFDYVKGAVSSATDFDVVLNNEGNRLTKEAEEESSADQDVRIRGDAEAPQP